MYIVYHVHNRELIFNILENEYRIIRKTSDYDLDQSSSYY